ncbi:MAG: alpha/beta hydrolase [Pseudomonadota bacterium]|nr:alpha/beta hydrolase [Pseudomonadota bacterium]
MKVQESETEVILEPEAPARACVIWLHGLGADGFDFVPVVEELRLPADTAIRFIFPHAAERPVTLNGGLEMRAWYDITGLDKSSRDDEPGIRDSVADISEIIAEQIGAGIPSQRIIVAGFSQGGAIALHCALREPELLGGLLALSTYLPLQATLDAELSSANRKIPVMMAHGTQDPVVSYAWGEDAAKALRERGYAVEWRSYPMQHQVCMEQIADIRTWLLARLGG